MADGTPVDRKPSAFTEFSANSRPRPDPRGFDVSPPPARLQPPPSAARSATVPDTPVRKVTQRELTERKLLLSSSKKIERQSSAVSSRSPRAASPGSSMLRGRKRYKDAVDTTSPLRPGNIPPLSPLRDVRSSSSLAIHEEDDRMSYDLGISDYEDADDADDDTLPYDSIPKISPAPRDHLGRGNFSLVMAVTCLENNKKYALKESITNMQSTAWRDKALKELQMWDSLRHNRITRFYRAWQDDAKLFVLMQLCESGPLDKYVRAIMAKSGSVDTEILRIAFQDCCSALAYMHDKGCVHMDIKPSNICLSNGHAMLCDFNLICKVGESFMEETDFTYQAFEVLSQNYRVHPSADIFALGISFYQLVTDEQLPPNGLGWQELRTRVPELQRFPKAQHHAMLFQYVQQCMRQNAGERPSARMLLEEPYIASEPAIQLQPIECAEDTRSAYARPASASFIPSPREGEMPRFAFDMILNSPMNRSPVPPRNAASRNPSPFVGHQKRLDFSSTCASPIEIPLDEAKLSDQFTNQAVVTPRPGTATPGVVSQLSRSSSPRLFTASPHFFQGAAVAAPVSRRPSQRPTATTSQN